MLVGQVTLRVLKPECPLEEAWCQEGLTTATQRTVLLLHSHTVPRRDAKAGECRSVSHVYNLSSQDDDNA